MTFEFTDNSKEVEKEFEAACLRALTKCGMVAENYSKHLAPVDTGLLRNSITYCIAGEAPAISEYKADKGDKKGSYSGTMGSSDELSVYLGSNVDYTAFLELGTSRSKAQPFLKPAVADHASIYQKIVEDEMKG